MLRPRRRLRARSGHRCRAHHRLLGANHGLALPRVSGSEVAMTNFVAANYLQDGARTVAEQKLAFEQNLAAAKEMLGGLPLTTVTISGTSITPAAGVAPFLSVATPGGAATANLTNCVPTSMKDGTWLALRMANAGQVVVVKHAAGGSGQFALAGGADLSLIDPTMILLASLSGTTWTEVGRFYGNQTDAGRTFYQVAGLGRNTFTGRQEWDMGAALVAAATLTLGLDGNSFHVTGTTTITAISAAPIGTRIQLVFDGELTILHNAATLILKDGQNITTRAGDVLEFLSEGSGWRQAGGDPLFDPRKRQIALAADFYSYQYVAGGDGVVAYTTHQHDAYVFRHNARAPIAQAN